MKFKSFPLLSLLSLPASGVVIYQTSDIRVGNILADPPYVRSFQMDVNNDGQIDWGLQTSATETFSNIRVVAPTNTLFIYRTPTGLLLNELAPLSEDETIGAILGDPDFRFLNTVEAFAGVLASGGGDGGPGAPRGPFYMNNAYLGFRFEAATGSHYGYALLQDITSSSAIIAAYA